MSLNNLANAISIRLDELGRTEDMEEVIIYNREAITLRPLGHPHRSRSLTSLADSVLTCFEQLGQVRRSG